MGRILVVEDDPAVQKALRRLFETDGYTVEVQSNGRSALESFQAAPPAVVILDLRLPKLSGSDVCKEIKALAPSLPIVVLSATSDVSDKVLLLELGADDYVTKPFSPRELLARVRAALRHTSRTAHINLVSFDGISVDFKKMEVQRDGKVVVLTAQEFKTLQFLVQNADRVIGRDELLNEVWGHPEASSKIGTRPRQSGTLPHRTWNGVQVRPLKSLWTHPPNPCHKFFQNCLEAHWCIEPGCARAFCCRWC
jgi:DNA-binding response OmpR family regulator